MKRISLSNDEYGQHYNDSLINHPAVVMVSITNNNNTNSSWMTSLHNWLKPSDNSL